MIGGVVLDAAALSDLAAGHTRRAATIVDYAIRSLRTILVPTTALMAAWADSKPEAQTFLALFPGLPVVLIDDLDQDTAVDAGAAAAEAGIGVPHDVMHTVHAATTRSWPVLSGRPDDIRALDPDLVVESTR